MVQTVSLNLGSSFTDGTRVDNYDIDKAGYAVANSFDVGLFKNLFSKSRKVGAVIRSGKFAGFIVEYRRRLWNRISIYQVTRHCVSHVPACIW